MSPRIPRRGRRSAPLPSRLLLPPEGEDDRRDVVAEVLPRSTGDTPKSKGKSVETAEEFPFSKKRKASEPEADTRDFTQKSTLEKAALFDSVIKRFISKPNLKVVRDLTEEEAVEQLHSSWIDHSIRMAIMSHRHTAGFRKLRPGLKKQTEPAVERGKEIEGINKGFEEDVLRNRDEIIEEWKTSKAGLEFAADMGLEASEVAAQEAVERFQDAFSRVYPQADWSSVEVEYNASINAAFHEGGDSDPALEVDDAIDIGDILGEELQQVEDPLASGAPTVQGEEAHEESSNDRADSSDSSSETGDVEAVFHNYVFFSSLSKLDLYFFVNFEWPNALRVAKRRRLAKAGLSSSSTSGVATGAPSVKLELDPRVEEGKQLPSFLAPKPEPKEVKAEAPASVKIEDPPAPSAPVTSSAVVVATASKRKPWPEEAMRLSFSALSRAKMAARFDKASKHLVTELEERACLKPNGQEVEAVKATMTKLSIKVLALARRSVPRIAAGAVSGEMSWDERNTLVNRLRLIEMRLSEAQNSMASSLKAFKEKKGKLEQSRLGCAGR
ncbi:hypothetical protein BVRB_7g163950 [Beta vulgaris subsp. vulgaris]|nr:hypothetical protein BVRB_7g163950 [Beta vulgaris subsp. vulgaris]